MGCQLDLDGRICLVLTKIFLEYEGALDKETSVSAFPSQPDTPGSPVRRQAMAQATASSVSTS